MLVHNAKALKGAVGLSAVAKHSNELARINVIKEQKVGMCAFMLSALF